MKSIDKLNECLSFFCMFDQMDTFTSHETTRWFSVRFLKYFRTSNECALPICRFMFMRIILTHFEGPMKKEKGKYEKCKILTKCVYLLHYSGNVVFLL